LTNNFLPVPKILQWEHTLSQTHSCEQSILLTSGCSFTSSTIQTKLAASWPGFVMDRCRFDLCIDYSFPGVGNDYICDSIIYHMSQVPKHEISKYMVIVMWSGTDRQENKVLDTSDPKGPILGNTCYVRNLIGKSQSNFVKRPITLTELSKAEQTKKSADKIIELCNYLTGIGVKFMFTLYSNILFPPYIPKRDTTYEFDNYIDKDKLAELRNLDWVPTRPMDFLYEYAFVNDFLNEGDYFHPPYACNLEWTDQVLLPGLLEKNLLRKTQIGNT
jgi:hypothetical protein